MRANRPHAEMRSQAEAVLATDLGGHAFQVVAIDGRPFQGAVRDTVLVMPGAARVRIAFDADNPGRWPFHCHNLYHTQTGMMTEVRYDGIAA
jgi:FtsP/CotA-like multicopper oxidase with cupredoxin domain